MRYNKDKPLAILGSGALAREFALWCFDAGIHHLVFVNDLPECEEGEWVDGRHIKVVRDWNTPYEFIVGIGNTGIKTTMVSRALCAGWMPAPTVVHPSANVRSPTGNGGLIAPNCVVTCDVQLGDYVTINLNCTVGHDTTIGAYTTMNPGVHVSGYCTIAGLVEIGTGAVIRNGVRICPEVMIGAGGAVVKDINESGVYVGVPCVRLR